MPALPGHLTQPFEWKGVLPPRQVPCASIAPPPRLDFQANSASIPDLISRRIS